ncbi:MAG: hypothetical protein GXO43_06320 [Crenarchaeota archaeon]|nr:hypothetical protein [Thermoproteota archaeon]
MKPKIEIVNIVATLQLDPMPDPREILEKIPGSRPIKRFRGAMIRIKKIPILFYRKKIVVVSARTRKELDRAIKDFLSLLMKHRLKTNLVETRIVNVTGYVALNRKLDLSSLAKKMRGIYDPDYLPYLVVKINNSTLVISQQGKIVILGAKSIEQVEELINYVSLKYLIN